MDIQIAMTILENGYKDAKILVPASSFKLESESRLLIPFTSFDKIGFMNRQGEIIVKPQYAMYYGDCYSPTDLVKVAVDDIFGFPKCNNQVKCYTSPLYGLMNYKGEIVLDTMYRRLELAIGCGNLATVQNKELKYGVIDLNGNVIVPFGRYDYIDGFDRGFARVKIGKQTNGQIGSNCKWGVIDEQGKEVLPAEYDNIWNFYGKDYDTIIVEKDKTSSHISFDTLNRISKPNTIPIKEEPGFCDRWIDDYEESHTYGEYEGSYVQDVLGWSDQMIGDALDGEPDAYWNID